jgi:hypothetical protein
MNLERIAALAAPSIVAEVDYEALLEKFKTSLLTDFKLEEPGD